jgi:membrane peptidoglycan carboxypeptidase
MAISRITDRDGNTTRYQLKCRQAFDPAVADATAGVLSGVFTKGTMRGVGVRMSSRARPGKERAI